MHVDIYYICILYLYCTFSSNDIAHLNKDIQTQKYARPVGRLQTIFLQFYNPVFEIFPKMNQPRFLFELAHKVG